MIFAYMKQEPQRIATTQTFHTVFLKYDEVAHSDKSCLSN